MQIERKSLSTTHTALAALRKKLKDSGEEEMGARGAGERGGVPRIKEGSDPLTHMTSV